MSFGKQVSKPVASDFWKPASIEKWTKTGTTAANDPIYTWAELHAIHGKPRDLGASEGEQAGREHGTERATFTTHMLPDFFDDANRKSYRLVIDSRVWDIVGVAEIAHRQFMKLTIELKEGNDQ
jgi:head-tail adaptor